ILDTLVNVGALTGSDTIKNLAPLVGSKGSGTFAFKYNHGRIEGTLTALDGTLGASIRVTISPHPRTIAPHKWGTSGTASDTTIKATAGAFYQTAAKVRDGIYIITPLDSVSTTTGDSIWAFFSPDKADTVTIHPGTTSTLVNNMMATRMDTKIMGVLMNDRDKDNAIDPGEPLAGVEVRLYKGYTTSSDSLLKSVTSDANGRFSFRRLRERTGAVLRGYTVSKPKVSAAGDSVFYYTGGGAGAYRDTVLVRSGATDAGKGAQLTREVGDTLLVTGGGTMNNYPAWDYQNNTPLYLGTDGKPQNVSNFTFLKNNGTLNGRVVKDGTSTGVGAMRVVVRRCLTTAQPDAVPGGTFPAAGNCISYVAPSVFVLNLDTDSSGNYTSTNVLREGRYEVTPQPATAGCTGTTVGSYVVEVRGDAAVGSANFSAQGCP
ncbi:MAG: hypothetical protein HY701_03020, partial [Gemmatimonadetes bacterium]|nr:hypothetical protein [Gemmatimonadota bacterium]